MNSQSSGANADRRRDRTGLALAGITVLFIALAAAFVSNLWGRPAAVIRYSLVDTNFLSTATPRQSYSDLVKSGDDISGYDCYACHDKAKTVALTYDKNHNIILPKEHEELVMHHGRHERNNNCYNCHNETNLELLQPRDGRELKFSQSSQLCGSCHGPTFRDWEAGAHGRVNGFWQTKLGEKTRKDCVNCHNPHAPKYPGRKPAPPPHYLHGDPKPVHLAQDREQGEHAAKKEATEKKERDETPSLPKTEANAH
jgi:uncharacterized CHY-type Zn-finger protein